VTALSVLDAEETIYPSAEEEEGQQSGCTNIDTDIPGLGFVAEAARSSPAPALPRTKIRIGFSS
jgi:hypothetical protein